MQFIDVLGCILFLLLDMLVELLLPFVFLLVFPVRVLFFFLGGFHAKIGYRFISLGDYLLGGRVHSAAHPIDVVADLGSVHVDDYVRSEVKHPLQRSGRHIEKQRHRTRNALQIPDMRYRRGQLDVTHSLSPHLGPSHLDPAAVANNALELDLLVAPAVALPVLHGAEYPLAEESVPLGLERSVIDRFRFLDFAARP